MLVFRQKRPCYTSGVQSSLQPFMLRALIFDFDGLIVDTESPAYQSWQEIYAEHGCALALGEWASAIGAAAGTFDVFAHLEAAIGRPVEREAILARRQARKLQLTAFRPLLPGVRCYLQDARALGLKLGVASSSSREWVAGNLERLGILGAFDCLSCREDAERAKPHPDLYEHALARLGLRPDEAIALEDSPNGVTAAKGAGLCCVAVPNVITAQLCLDHADLCVPSLDSLPLEALIARLSSARAPAPPALPL